MAILQGTCDQGSKNEGLRGFRFVGFRIQDSDFNENQMFPSLVVSYPRFVDNLLTIQVFNFNLCK